MRADRFRSLQQRLRREADAFEFGALIDGVSTMGPDAAEPEFNGAGTPQTPPPADIAAAPEVADPTPTASAAPSAPVVTGEPPTPTAAAPKARKARVPEASVPDAVPVAQPGEDRVRVALDALGSRLLQASSRFRAATAAGQAEESGLRLADMNQILELLRSVDPTGDASRKLGTACAPPKGRTWPRPVWTVAEFAESPLSGMLPSGAGECFVRSVLYSAWGVTFD